MKNKIIVVTVLMLVPIIYLLVIWNNLPPILPMHFNLRGDVDRYGSKTAVVVMIAILTGVSGIIFLLFSYIHRLNPKMAPRDNKDRMQKIGVAVVAFMVIIQCWTLYTIQKGELALSIKFVLIAVGLLFAVIGNYMPNLKPNYVAGFRLPWTLHNENNWKRTHDIAGKLWFFGGIIAAFLCIIFPFKLAIFAMIILLLVLIIVPAVYSYKLYKQTHD